jgi:glycosyltransferase involved in cell wall biosynthesis
VLAFDDMGKIPATVTVLTRNSGQTLGHALESVKDFDDIVICDGGSTDDTLAIAHKYEARIITQDKQFLDAKGKIYDYGGVRNQTLSVAKHNWIFWLDSDERCGKDLAEAIRKIIETRGEDGGGAFWVNRKYVLSGTVIDCAATYPNRQMRFFSKRSSIEFVKKVHERIKLKPGVTPEYLEGFMYLPTDDDLLAIRRKWDYQIAVAAAQSTPLTLGEFVISAFHTVKVSILWFARLLRNSLFCSGTKMPLKYEMERHYFHLKLLRALWREVKFK